MSTEIPRRKASAKNTAEALYNRDTGNLWLEYPDSRTVQLGTADNPGLAYEALGRVGLIRTGNWLPAYGPVRSCTVGEPEGWTPPASGS